VKEKKLTQSFFDQRAVQYHEFAYGERSKEVRRKIKQIIDQEIYGKVIDIGGGGEVHYEISKSNLFAPFDISHQQLKKGLNNNKLVYPVCGDAEDLPFKNNIFNRAICGFLLHHLVEDDSQKSDRLLSKILSGFFEILDTDGKLMVIENCLPKTFEKIENFFFVLFKKILELFGKPAVRFLSYSSIGNLLKETGFKDIVVIPMKEKKSWGIVPLGIILPFFGVPQKLIPTNIYIIVGKKA